ncbi:MAG: hypothetical protein H6Q77_2746 [Gemmatimonadetes bacterium]|nr:hypothetical protein [Gemmatimonadota bacterium]
MFNSAVKATLITSVALMSGIVIDASLDSGFVPLKRR